MKATIFPEFWTVRCSFSSVRRSTDARLDRIGRFVRMCRLEIRDIVLILSLCSVASLHSDAGGLQVGPRRQRTLLSLTIRTLQRHVGYYGILQRRTARRGCARRSGEGDCGGWEGVGPTVLSVGGYRGVPISVRLFASPPRAVIDATGDADCSSNTLACTTTRRSPAARISRAKCK